MHKLWSIVAMALLAATLTAEGRAEGNLASRATRLDPLVIDIKKPSFSLNEYRIETGKYYRWTIKSGGGDEILIVAPELFRNVWINEIVTAGIEIKPMGGIHGIELDEEGEVHVWFVPIRPGEYKFWGQGYEDKGLVGKFVVK